MTRQLDSLGSFAVDDGSIEAICWTHRGGGWAVHDWRGARREAGVRTKREAERIVRRWSDLPPATQYEIEPLRRAS